MERIGVLRGSKSSLAVGQSVQPAHSEFDHMLRLYLLPTAVCHLACFVDVADLLGWTRFNVLADKYKRYQMTYSALSSTNQATVLETIEDSRIGRTTVVATHKIAMSM